MMNFNCKVTNLKVCKKTLDYLLKNGEAYVITDVLIKTHSICVICSKAIGRMTYIGEVCLLVPEDEWWVCKGVSAIAKLYDFLHKSGFKSVENWLEDFKKLNNGNLPDNLYIYKIKVLDKIIILNGCNGKDGGDF